MCLLAVVITYCISVSIRTIQRSLGRCGKNERRKCSSIDEVRSAITVSFYFNVHVFRVS